MAQIVTIKPVIMPAQQRSDGSWNVKIRVTFKRRYKILSTNLTAYRRDLAKSGELKGRILIQANEIVARMYQAVGELNWFDFDRMQVEDIVLWIRRSLAGKSNFELDLFEYADRFLAAKKDSTARTYRTAINEFRAFVGKGHYDINDITVTTLKEFIKSVNVGKKKRGISAKYYISRLSAIYSEAMMEYNDEDAGVLNIPRNPFKRIKVDAEPSVARISQSPEFIQKIIDTKENATHGQQLALDIYLISFALMGANTVDLLTMSAADEDGVITYYRTKTKDRRTDHAEMRVRIEPCVRPLLERFKDPKGKLQFNFAGRWKTASAMNSWLRLQFASWAEANEEKAFTMYSARHSWATIARSGKVGLSKSLIDECLAHSSNTLVDVYAEKDWSILWEANKKVLSVFNWNSI